MRGTRYSVASCILGVLLAAPAAAQPGPPAQAKAEMEAAWLAAKKVAVTGPADVPLAGEAHLKLPAGEAFIPAAEANRLMQAMGNGAGPGRVGLILGRGKDSGWMVDVGWTREGYVKDGDAKDWKADEMLQSLKEGTDASNPGRLARGIPAIDVVGWVQPPTYDAAAHRLVWSLSLKERGAAAGQPQTINYNTYALGREGYFSLDLITGADTIAADKHVATELLANLDYVPGKKYQDFNGSTDKVAAYGLAALVGVVAAKKVGLIAMMGLFFLKAWKLLLVAFAAVGAGVKRFFGRRGKGDEETAYDAEPAAAAVATPAAAEAGAEA